MLPMKIERQRLSIIVPKGESLDTQEIAPPLPLLLVSGQPTHAGLSRPGVGSAGA
jgi:hypothetical protein